MDITVKVPQGTQSVSIDNVKGGTGGTGGVIISPIKTPTIDKLPSHLYDPSKLPPGIFTLPNSIGGVPISANHPTSIDYPIQGKMITVDLSVDEFNKTHLTDDEIKIKLVYSLAEEMLKQKCIEFTKQERFDLNATIFRARVYVTPDSQTRIIRQIQK